MLECVTPFAAKTITNKLKIPTIGIGSSSHCDGQILVTDDILGLSGFYPKFVKKYINLNAIIEKAIKQYSKDVKKKYFQKTKIFYMENEIQNKSGIIQKIVNFLRKKKIIISIFIIIIFFLFGFKFLTITKKCKSKKISEKYIKAGLYLSTKQKRSSQRYL